MDSLSEQEFLRDFGQKIKETRMKKGLSLNKLASEHGFEKASFSRLESGKSNVTLKTLFKLSVAFEVSPSHFFENKVKESL